MSLIDQDYDIATARADMARWNWWGVPTFFRCPWNEDFGSCDIGLVGVPHSAGNGSTDRNQHLGPRQIRNLSGRHRRYNQALLLNPWEECRIHDLGDVPLTHGNDNEKSIDHIETFFLAIAQSGCRPVAYGGDHSITGPILKALAGESSKLDEGQKISLVHFDAHRDDLEHMPHWLGAERSAAHWAAYTVREGAVDPSTSIQIGIRGNPSKPMKSFNESPMGYEIVSADDVFELGLSKVSEMMKARIGDNPVYVTFDLDSLDPSDAPGVSNVEAGYRGLRAWEAIKLLHALRGRNIIGADVVCAMPTRDNPNDITGLTGSVIMFELLSLIADFLKSQS